MPKEWPIPEGQYHRTASGQTIHYHELGSPGGRPSILFLHGSGPGASGYSNFKGNFPVFAEAGHHVLAIDYPGYGYASQPTDLDYSTDFYVRELHDLIVAKHIAQVIPVGNSLGGLLATAYTLAWPANVPKLILMAPGGMAEGSTYIPFMVGLNAMFGWVGQRPQDEASFRRVLSLLVHDPAMITDDAFKERFPIALKQPTEVWSRMRVSHLTERLPELACPILAFWGAKDRFIPVSHATILLERARDVKMVISNRAGHWYMVEELDDFNTECLTFLAQ